jgi:hypothetical protein
VKWARYAKPTWELASNLEEIEALDAYKAYMAILEILPKEGGGNITG